MGGYGSGRPRRNQLAEDCRNLDVNRLNREGCLKPGWSGNWRWHRDGEQVAGISLSAEQSRLIVSFHITEKTGDYYDVEQSILSSELPATMVATDRFWAVLAS